MTEQPRPTHSFLKIIRTVLKVTGIIIMPITFLVFPDSAPWYYEKLLFNLGLLLVFIGKFPKIKRIILNKTEEM